MLLFEISAVTNAASTTHLRAAEQCTKFLFFYKVKGTVVAMQLAKNAKIY